jgi:hypothetical protein
MADISILSRLINGIQRNVDLSQNSLVVGSLKVGVSSPTELTKAILDNLLTLQNGSDIAASLHHHDGRYFTETELSSTGATSGADRIGVNNTPANYSASGQTVQDHLEGIDAALTAAGNERADNLFRIVDNLDNTKKIAFEAANIATATVRTITMPNANVNLADVVQALLQDGTRAMLANLSLGNFKITNLANGTNPNDAINLSQLDAALAGLDFQKDINALVANATTTAPGAGLPAAATGQRYILESGAGSLNVAWGTITGVANNDVVEYNGTAWVVSYDVSVQGEGALVWNRAENYFMRWDGSTWNEFGGLAGITAGAGLLKSGNVLSIELDTNSGLEFDVPGDGGKLRVLADDSTIERSASGIRVKDLGITLAKLAANSVDATKLADDAVTTSKILNLNVTTAKIANAAIDQNKLASAAADQETITGGSGAALAVARAPQIARTLIAGESFAANTSFLVRRARNGETAGRVYKADNNAASNDNFYVIGIALATSAVSAGGSIRVVSLGSHALGSSDSSFSASDVGRPVYLTTAGAFSVTAPTAVDTAVVRIGVIENTTILDVLPMQLNGIN